MNNLKVLRGLVLIAIGLFFGIQASTYHLGTFANAGAGLFPLLVSGIVGLIGAIMIVQSRFEQAEAIKINYRNILIVLASLIGFILIAQHLKLGLAIIYLVFLSTVAGADYSVSRNIKICLVLMAIAYAFHRLLGVNLELI